jgi:hypothetical protein
MEMEGKECKSMGESLKGSDALMSSQIQGSGNDVHRSSGGVCQLETVFNTFPFVSAIV